MPQWQLTVIAPGGVLGPPLGRNISGQSMSMLDANARWQNANGAKSSLPHGGRARRGETARAGPEHCPRQQANGVIAASSEPNGFLSAAQILKEEGYKGPSTRIAPNFLMRLMAKFNREAAGAVGILGMHLSCDNSETRNLFNWTPIPFKQSVLDSAAAIKSIQSKVI